MTSRICKVVVGAFLAAISMSALAGEPKCTASVCDDPMWAETTVVSPAMTMTAHVSDEVVATTVAEHVATDESPAGDPEAIHAHMASHASFKAVCADMEKHVACDELPAGEPEAVHLHPGV